MALRLRSVGMLLAGLALGFAGCSDCPPEDELHLLRNPDPATTQMIEACRADRSRCLELCRHLVQSRTGSTRPIVHCELHEDRAGYLQVHVVTDYLCI